MEKEDKSSLNQGEHIKRKRAPGRILLPLASIFFCLLAGELVIRVFFWKETDTGHLKKQQQRIEVGKLIRPSSNPELFHELKPNLATTWLGKPVFTDNDGSCRIGVQSADEHQDKPPLKIALLGDSTSFGWGITYEDTYAEILRKNLENYFKTPVELRNYSVPGYNTHQELFCFKVRVSPWRPDLLILHYDHNDPDPTNIAPPNYMEPEYGDNFLRSSLIKFILRRARVMRNKRLRIFKEDDKEKPSKSLDLCKYSGALYENHLEELRELAAEAKALNIPVIAVIFDAWIPYVPDTNKDPHYRLLHAGLVEHLDKAGMHVLDLYPHYQKMMKDRGWKNLRPFWLSVHLGDCHPNAAGHAFIASKLFQYIASQEDLSELFSNSRHKNGSPPSF